MSIKKCDFIFLEFSCKYRKVSQYSIVNAYAAKFMYSFWLKRNTEKIIFQGIFRKGRANNSELSA